MLAISCSEELVSSSEDACWGAPPAIGCDACATCAAEALAFSDSCASRLATSVIRRDTLLEGVKRIERWIRRLQRERICDADIDPWATALALHAMNVSVAYDHLVHRNAPEETEALLRATMRIWCATLGLRR